MSEAEPFDGVLPELRTALERRGFSSLTAIQAAVMAQDSAGRNLRISSQTGSGKTVAIGLALGAELLAAVGGTPRKKARGPMALIITPTRELAAQVRDELGWLYENLKNLQVAVVTGGTDVMRERRFLLRGPQLLVGTPGRLLDHIRAGAVDCSQIKHVVLDEADQMLDMGFRDELEAIVEALPEDRKSHLVSATFAHQMKRFADRFQDDPLHIEGTALGAANADIEHSVHVIPRQQSYAALVNTLLLLQGERCLVFVRRRCDAAEISELLAGDGFSALPFSGDLPQGQRTRTLNAFRNGIVNTLVATDVAARGIDVSDIAAVVQLDPPGDGDTYTHRSGRTGRAGKKGRSVLFIQPQAERSMRRLLKNAGVDASWGALPSPKKIAKTLQKRSRRELHEILDSDAVLGESEREYAGLLLERYDPIEVIGRLLQLATPKLPREPMEVVVHTPRGDTPGKTSRGYATFTINWGMLRGAAANRLIAHICRRGDISSQRIGAIDLGPESSTFEVALEDADAFELRVAKPDSRDPHIRIERKRGGAEGGDSRPRAHRGKPSRGGPRYRSSKGAPKSGH